MKIQDDNWTTAAAAFVRSGAIEQGSKLPSLEVGEDVMRPFGGKLRKQAQGRSPGLSVGDGIGGNANARGAANEIMDLLARVGGTPCRMWGATPPIPIDDGCPSYKKLCGAILPYNVSVAASATGQSYTVLAKKWYWPLFWVDASASTVTVVSLLFQGDPVFENGTGSGALIVSSLLAAAGNYGFVPGLPAIDNTNGLVFSLANSAGAAAQFQGMFIGLSIRN